MMNFLEAYGGRKEPKSMCSLHSKYQDNAGKEAGYVDAIYGVIDGQHFHIYGMKDPNYTMTLITTYGTLEISVNERKWYINGDIMRFKYPGIIWNYYTY